MSEGTCTFKWHWDGGRISDWLGCSLELLCMYWLGLSGRSVGQPWTDMTLGAAAMIMKMGNDSSA